MGKLHFFPDLEQKKNYFNQSDITHYKIDYAWEFINWYDQFKGLTGANPFDNFFRGVNEARYKLYNSSQRYWIQNNLTQLESLKQPLSYVEMIQNMVNNAKENKLFQQVFQYYEIQKEQMDIPILSILQHYAAPTPLMDWTYDIDIALFFAIQNLRRCEIENSIEDYISIYHIHKAEHNAFVMNNLNYISANVFPNITNLSNYLGNNRTVYISDFEISEFDIKEDKKNRKIKPLTTYYNLNILAQKGIFIFNPNEALPLEELAGLHPIAGVDNRIYCYNINKDLIELIKLKIGKNEINESFIYPDLKNYANRILNDYLQWVVNT